MIFCFCGKSPKSVRSTMCVAFNKMKNPYISQAPLQQGWAAEQGSNPCNLRRSSRSCSLAKADSGSPFSLCLWAEHVWLWWLELLQPPCAEEA